MALLNAECSFYVLLLICSLLTIDSKITVGARGPQHVTCGSIFKLMNTAYKVRLHSHDVKYGSGSGQQSVTGSELKEDANSHWMVKGSSKEQCKRGEPVACGSTVRLEHLATHKNLHSHLFSAPISGGQEVSAFGDSGEGDTGDNWTVICSGEAWNRDDVVKLKHVDTGTYLSASGHTYGRPIQGQMEIIGRDSMDHTSHWQVMEGVFIHPNEAPLDHSHQHTEL